MTTNIVNLVSDLFIKMIFLFGFNVISGRFLYNNYKQALNIISEYAGDIEELKTRLNITDEVIEGWIGSERQFLKDLKHEPEERILEMAYVEALIARDKAE